MPLCEKEEREFAELHDKCRKLKVMPPPAIFINFEVKKDGEILHQDRVRGHSWTRNFYNYICSLALWTGGSSTTWGAGHLCAKEDGEFIQGADTHTFAPSTNALIGNHLQNNSSNSTFGILVGTSDAAFSADHHNLQGKIAHGTGAGQLAYSGVSNGTKSYNGVTKIWKVSHVRIINNNSAGAIDVKESGLIAYLRSMSSSRAGNFLLERSVLPSTVNVPVGAQLTVTYEITMDFSAID